MDEGTEKKPTALEQRRAMVESGEFQREFVRQLLTPQDLEAIGSGMKRLLSFREQLVSGLAGFLQRPEVGLGLQALHAALTSPKMGEIVQTLGELSRKAELLADSPLAEYLASDRGQTLGKVVEGAGVATVTITATCDARVIRAGDLALEREIVNHLQQGADVAQWTPAQLSYLRGFLLLIQWVLLYLATQNAVRGELCFFQPKLVPTLTANQTGKAVRAFMCDAELPEDFLRGFRQVKGERVRLRSAPSMKATVVEVRLDDRALLEVLDSSNRDWLHVAVVSQDGVEGWISRRYTHQLLK